jgi:hypothetical protein
MPNPGFSDAEENEPAQSILLDASKALLPGDKIPLKLVKFQNVHRWGRVLDIVMLYYLIGIGNLTFLLYFLIV